MFSINHCYILLCTYNEHILINGHILFLYSIKGDYIYDISFRSRSSRKLFGILLLKAGNDVTILAREKI